MLDAIVYNGCTHRLLRLGVALVFVSTLVDLLAASPTTVYDSYGDNRALPVRVDDRSSGGTFFSSPLHPPHSAQQGAGETLPPVQQQLVVGGGGGVTRVPWYGLTELSDVLLLGVLVTVAVLGTLLFVVLVLGLRAKLHLLRQDRAAAGNDRAELAADYAQECSAIKCVGSGGKGKVIKTPPASPPILLLEAGAVVKPVPTTCIAVTGVDGGRRRTEQHLNQSDKRHRSPGGRGSKRRPLPVASGQPLPVATVNMSASIGATASIDSATSSASGRETTEHVTIDDKDRLHRGQPSAEQGEEQQQQQPVSPLPSAPPPPSDKRNVLKRQAVAELSVFAGLPAPGTPGSGSPTAYLQLLTPLSASSLSTSAATTDNNATPTKGEPGGGSAAGGGPLSAAESMAAARFGFSPRSIHSFTMQTATYFRFPDVDDFTPTPRTLPKRHGGAGGDETCSTPPAVDARTEEEEEDGGSQLRRTERETAAPKVAVLAPSPGSMPLPPSPPAKGNPKEGEIVTQDVVAAIVEQMEQLQAPPPPPPASTSIEPHRPTARICAPMANRRVRLKSISLDSEGARLVEENLTSTIPVQELVGMAAHRTGGFDSVIDDDDDDEEENERDDDDDDDDDGHDERANASAAHNETDEDEDEAAAAAKQRSAARAKRVRNILNLRLNIPPLPTGGGTGSMATQGRPPPPGASQSTGSVAKPIVKTVTVTGSVSNPTMSTQQQQQQPTLHHRHHIEDSNEQFYFEYFDYGDEEDETDDEYDEVEYGEEHEDNNNNNNNSSSGSGSHTVALPPVPKTPTLSQYKQKASSLDSDKLKISIQYGGSGGGGGGGGNGGGGNSSVYSSVSCGGGMSTIMSIAQCQGQGMSLHNTYSHSHTQQQFGQFQFHQQPQQQQQQQPQQHTSQQPAGQLQQPRRVSSVSVPTTPKRYQYRTAANHHYYHHQQQQQQQQQHYASGQSKLKPSYHPGPVPAPSAGGDSGGATANGNRKEKKSPLGLKAMGGCGGEGGTIPTQSQSQSPSEQGGKQDDGTKPSVPTSGRSSILQRRGSNHSLTLNLDVYNRSGGSVDLTSSSCTSLYRGSYKNLHQVQSHTQLYQPAHQHPVEPPVRVQCHQASPQQPAPGSATVGDGTTTTSGTMHNNNNNNNGNGSNANTSKKNLLQRRGSNTSLTLNLRSGVGAGGGTGSTFGLNRFSSHNSLNTGMASALGASNSHQHHSQQQQQQYHQQQHQQHQQQFPSSSMVRLAGSRKSLLERRNSNASLTLINVNQRTLSVSNCNLRGSICSLNSLLTTHTQNEPGPSDMMLEEDELDGNGDNDHHHYHHHHHHNHHHHHHHHGQHVGHSGPHHGGLHRGGGEGELRRFGSSVDAPFTGTDGAGVQSEMGRAGSRYNQAHERSEQQHHQHLHHAVGGGGHHEESRSARQRKFRSSDSLHNINVREQGLHGGHGAAGPLQSRLMDADSKLMSGSGYPQCSCQSSFDERHHYGSSENFKEHQNKLSIHRGLFQRDPATVTSTSSANNLSALGTGTMYSGCCCPCCCGCCGCCGGVAGIGSHLDGCCGVSGPLKAGGNLSSSNSNVRNISTKPLSPQTTSEDFKIYLANIQFLQNASNVLTMAYLRKLHNFFTKTYRKMVAATATAAQEAFQQQQQQKEDAAHKGQHESTKADGEAATTAGTKMMLLHSDSLHHPPVCDDESYEEEHKRMVLKIHQEFWDLPTNYQEKPLVFGSQAKNRYKTILPNEHSRVILEPERSPVAGGEPYINANYIKGPDYANNSYIATQGPLPNTIYEFWLMVYQNVARTATLAGRSCASAGLEQKIVMLTNFVENGRQKCAIYFPQTADEWVAFGSGADIDVGEMLREKDTITASIAAAEQQQQPEGQEVVGGVCQPVTVRVPCASCFFLVHNVAVEQRNGYTVRTLNVIYGAKVSDADAPDGDGSRALFELTQFRAHHYWFPDWPDHRSPKDINVLLDLSLDVLGSNVVDTPRPESSNSLKGNQPGTPGLEEVMGAAQLAALSSSCTPTVLPIVHCSAGIGRTGCLIAILNGLRQLRLSVMAHQRKQQQLKQSQAQAGEAGNGELQTGGSKSAADRMQDELEQSLPLPPVPGSGPEGRRKSTVQMDGATLLAPNAAVGRGGQREGSAAVRESGQVDILGIVCNLRLQRGGMVQNSEQYELIHRALCLYLEKLTQDGHI